MFSRALSQQLSRDSSHVPCLFKSAEFTIRCLSAVPGPKPKEEKTKPKVPEDERKSVIPENFRFKYQDFLPAPKMEWRNPIKEKLERRDMMARRAQIDIPEFYVGSILAVYSNNKHAADKKQKFVGICIEKGGQGLNTWFQLRNVIDHIGVEMKYDTYDPTLERIEVLRLEKRLDNQLLYLRDTSPEHSTFPLDMEAEFISEDEPVPINPIKVKLGMKPWLMYWEKWDLKGIEPIPEKLKKGRIPNVKPWEKMDLMKQYRETIPEEEQQEIYAELYSELHQHEVNRRKIRRKQDPKKKK